MTIEMRPLLVGETNRIAIDYDFSLTGDTFPFDIAIDGVVFTKPAHVEGDIVNMGGYIRLHATICVEYDAVCARCLKPLKRSFATELSRTVVEQGELVGSEEETGDDYIEIVDGKLEPDAMAAEQLMMDFPLKELCSEDCKGLCSKCGKDLNEGACGCSQKEIDPRLLILQKLLEK